MITKIYKKKPYLITLLLAILMLVFSYLLFFKQNKLIINSHTINIEIVKTDNSKLKGLSNRTVLPKNNGMLFVFNSEGKYCFWMKDMKFPIDIIWIDSKKMVVDIKNEISPNTYPQEFCPTQNAKYVLEINSGQANSLNIQTGNLVKF